MKITGWILMGVVFGLLLSYRPWVELRQAKAEMAEQRTELRYVQKKRVHWIRENARTSSRQGMREVLRENGYYAEGEVPLREVLDK